MTARRIFSVAFLVLACSAAAWAQSFTITNTSLPTGTVNQDYSADILNSASPNDSITWTLTGTLPPGLNFVTDGSYANISGVPTVAGAYPITIAGQDDTLGQSDSKQFTIYISTGLPLTIAQANLPGGAVSLFYSFAFSASGGVPGYKWSLSSGTTFDGMSLDPNTGVLAGFPQSGGTFQLGVVATDAFGTQTSRTFTLNVLEITSSTLPNGSVGAAYSQPLGVVGAVLPASWALFGGTLPPGLNLGTDGQITGTPTTTGAYQFSVRVTDSTSNTIVKTLSLTIATNLTITPATLPNGSVGISYSQQLQVKGGTAPYTWALASGSLPAGLTLNASTGAITGTPTTAGSQTFTVKVTDSGSGAGTATLTLTIDNFSISPATLPNGFTGVSYSAALSVSGSPTGLTWAVSAGTLPGGLVLNAATGAITGTPNAAGSFAFTVQATLGSNGYPTASAQQNYTVRIGTAPTVTVSGLPATGVPAQQPKASVSLSGPYSLDINGTMTLTFVSSVGGDDQMVKFSNGTRTATFTIPAGSTQGSFGGASNVAVLTGTVAGTITITTVLTDSAQNTLPPPDPTVIVINPTPPVITRVTITTVTGGFNVSVTGYSTPRDMVSATFHFAPTTGTTLAATDVTVQLTAPFTTWYSNPASNAFGSQFTMTVPFTFSGPPGTTFPVVAVTVNLTNSKGTSTTSPPANP